MTRRDMLKRSWEKAKLLYPQMSWRKRYEWACRRAYLDIKQIDPRVRISHAIGYYENHWRFIRSLSA